MPTKKRSLYYNFITPTIECQLHCINSNETVHFHMCKQLKISNWYVSRQYDFENWKVWTSKLNTNMSNHYQLTATKMVHSYYRTARRTCFYENGLTSHIDRIRFTGMSKCNRKLKIRAAFGKADQRVFEKKYHSLECLKRRRGVSHVSVDSNRQNRQRHLFSLF